MGGAPPPPLGFAPQGGPEAALFGAARPPAETPRGSTPRGGSGAPPTVSDCAASDPSPGGRQSRPEGSDGPRMGAGVRRSSPAQSVILASGTAFPRVACGSPRSASSARLRCNSPGGWGGRVNWDTFSTRAGVLRTVPRRGEGYRAGPEGGPGTPGVWVPPLGTRQGADRRPPGVAAFPGVPGVPPGAVGRGQPGHPAGVRGCPPAHWEVAGNAPAYRTGWHTPDPPDQPPIHRTGRGGTGGPPGHRGAPRAPPRAHFFGYLITLPVGTKMGQKFSGIFSGWDKLRGTELGHWDRDGGGTGGYGGYHGGYGGGYGGYGGGMVGGMVGVPPLWAYI